MYLSRSFGEGITWRSEQDVVNLLKHWIMNVGAPVSITTDGGPQFQSRVFTGFCKEWGITHYISSPYNHPVNGSAEAAVKSVKHLAMKCTRNGNLNCDEFREGLLELRNTPRASGLSPAELVYGRPLRTKVPAHPSIYRPVERNMSQDHRNRAAEYFNSRAGDLPKLTVGTFVRVQDPNTQRWSTIATVVRMDKRGCSYTVEKMDGSTFWRNRRCLRPYYGPAPF